MGHDQHEQGPVDDDAASWNATYEEKPTIWSGKPNAQLVAEAASLRAGTALDVGCGEGADAVWLAGRGWQVTATDISSVALDRAREHGAAAGADIRWVEVDLINDPPARESFDLVSAQFFQLADPPRNDVMKALGAAVSPGGHLLVVGHHPDGELPNPGRSRHGERVYAPDEITALFDPDSWDIRVSESRERTAMHHGEMTDLIDTVVLLRRT